MKLLLIDGHYYVYRSFFAIPNLSNSRGEPTNAIFGFTKTLRLMLKHLQPQLGAVFWDEGLPQRRVELQPAYKETRKEMPRPMIPQLDFIRSTITPLLGFTDIALPDTEADDLMGCYSIAACRDEHRGGARDKRQRPLSARWPVRQSLYHRQGRPGLAERRLRLARRRGSHRKWGVPPALIGDVLAIAGDTVDNIPGVGIGRKTAAGLIREHGGLEALLANLASVKSLKTREKLQNGREQILQNRKMVELDCKTELPVAINRLPFARITRDSSQPWKSVSLSRFYRRCGRKQPGRLPRSKGS